MKNKILSAEAMAIKNRHMQNITIVMLRTNCSFAESYKALKDMNHNVEGACELLKLTNQLVPRYKNVYGKKIPWTREDFIEEAKNRTARREKMKVMQIA